MATKMENPVGVNFAIFRSNPWRQFTELLHICCKDTNIHENVENKISDFWLHKAQNVKMPITYIVHIKIYVISVQKEQKWKQIAVCYKCCDTKMVLLR